MMKKILGMKVNWPREMVAVIVVLFLSVLIQARTV